MNVNKALWPSALGGIVLVIILAAGCFGSSEVTKSPIVRVTDSDYDEDMNGFSYYPFLDEFADEYQGDYSDELRDNLIKDMKDQAEELGEDPDELGRCIKATGAIKKDLVRLPCIAEKAKFNGSAVWIFVFTWGFDKNDLGHEMYFVIEISTLEELHFETCG